MYSMSCAWRIRFRTKNVLTCHTEIQERINNKKGYHSSSDVKGKECFSCHSEHNGKTFQLIRLDAGKFNHSLTGYTLSAPHAARQCQDCHNQKYITDQKLKTKKSTYLGLEKRLSELSCRLPSADSFIFMPELPQS